MQAMHTCHSHETVSPLGQQNAEHRLMVFSLLSHSHGPIRTVICWMMSIMLLSISIDGENIIRGRDIMSRHQT